MESSVAEVTPPKLDDFYELALGPADFFEGRSKASTTREWSGAEVGLLAQRIVDASAQMTQEAFYPLVQNLFVAAGFAALRPNRGDTCNRVDLILIDDESSLPVEIKSPAEAKTINIKSVQQALENWVVLSGQSTFGFQRQSSSLVVGFEYPTARSGVHELVEAVHTSYGVNIGLISLRELSRLATESCLMGARLPRTRLSGLRGRL